MWALMPMFRSFPISRFMMFNPSITKQKIPHPEVAPHGGL